MDRIIIDVREPYEYAQGHVNGALNIPLAELSGSKELNDIAKDTEIVLYCRSGGRAGAGIEALRQLGFTNTVNGINAAQVQKSI